MRQKKFFLSDFNNFLFLPLEMFKNGSSTLLSNLPFSFTQIKFYL